MPSVRVLPACDIAANFIDPKHLPRGCDEYYQRNKQNPRPKGYWRHLDAGEIEILTLNNNSCKNWDTVLVCDPFDPSLIKSSDFFGLVRIGKLEQVVLEHHDMRIPAGITGSRIIACDLGDNVAIHHVHYLAHYIIGNTCLLLNVDEMHTTDHAKFGNGITLQGETENARVWIEVMNEAGSRGILPFNGITSADAWLWAKYRDKAGLQKKLLQLTQKRFDNCRGRYGTVGEQCVIKNCRIIKDAAIGPHSYINGANKLKNLTINSCEAEPVRIGEGVEMVNGIVGYGCHIFYGCKAVRFVLGTSVNLKYGARLINSFLGDNSTVSCCEVLNNLIFPAHEQHHNNSFLIAAALLGQSNIAAGATIGSNHNSRSNDNEVLAGRGFWPGLCTSIKHSSRFASFTPLAKGDYPAELDIQLPFSLLNNDRTRDRLEVMPAFWWRYNMYALARNSWKFRSRDTRVCKAQNIEFDALAPDTVEEIFIARTLLERWIGAAGFRGESQAGRVAGDREKTTRGIRLLTQPDGEVDKLDVFGEGMEKSGRTAVILKPASGYHAYGDMIHYYAVSQIAACMAHDPALSFPEIASLMEGQRDRVWINMGGQLMTQTAVASLIRDITAGTLDSWDAIHGRYRQLWEEYPRQKLRHACLSLRDLYGWKTLTPALWNEALDRAATIQQYVCEQVYASRKKDYDNPFRAATFRNTAEMNAVIGDIADNRFIAQVRSETVEFKSLLARLRKRI